MRAAAAAEAGFREIRTRLRNADVLIHIEPEASVRPGTELPLPVSEG